MAQAASVSSTRSSGWGQRRVLLFIALVAPVFILRFVTSVYPIGNTIWLSFTNTHLIDQTSDFVGFENYQIMPKDPAVRSAVGFTIVKTIIATALQLILGLLIALMLNAARRGRNFGRAINLIPWAIPGITAAYAFRWILDDQFGLIPEWTYQLTGTRPLVFLTAFSARTALILLTVWKSVSFVAILFLAGLQGVPPELYEAAKVDGANAWQGFRAITLPLVLPLVITMSIFLMIGQLGGIDLVYGLTNGGPGNATATLGLRIFQEGMRFFKFGYASAISVVLLLLICVIGALGILVNRKVEVNL
ncbi:MAG: sugar ABC transporter permease [Chloroflexota bacterium]